MTHRNCKSPHCANQQNAKQLQSRLLIRAAIAIATVAANVGPVCLGEALFTPLGFPAPSNAVYDAVALSADGETAVLVSRCPEDRLWYCDDSGDIGEGYNYWSTIWTAESGFAPIGPARAADVSADGSVVVGGNLGDFEAFRWTSQAGVESLGTRNEARAVSSDGEFVVGGSFTGGRNSYLWTEGQGDVRFNIRRDLQERGTTGTDLASAVSADGSVVVGGTEFDPGNRMVAWRWTQETGAVAIPGLDGALQSHANDMTPDSRVIIGQSGIDGVLGGNGRFGFGQPFRWTESSGTQVLEGYDDGLRTYGTPTGVSSDGAVIVGFAKEDTGRFGNDWFGEDDVAFIWDFRSGTRYLKDVLEEDFGLGEELSRWQLTRVDGISDDGLTLLGTGFSPAGRIEPWLVTLDSPIALWGDFDEDKIRSLDDLQLLGMAIADGGSVATFDVNTDGLLNGGDHSYWVEWLAGWRPGDADLDGEVSFSDFLLLSASFEAVGGWDKGDFDGDNKVDFEDFLILSANFGVAPGDAVAVPEPRCLLTLLVPVVSWAAKWRRHRSC